MNKKLTIPSLLIPLILLSACGGKSHESIVMNSYFKYVNYENEEVIYNKSYTIGQAFSNRSICDEVEWTSFKDARGRDLVDYKCQFKKGKERYASYFKSSEEYDIKSIKESYTKLLDRIESIQKGIDIQKAKARSKGTTYSISWYYKDELKALKNKLNKEYPYGATSVENKVSKIKEKYSKVTIPVKIVENYQWTVTNENQPVFSYSGVNIHYSKGELLSCEFPLLESLNIVYSDYNINSYKKLWKTVSNRTTDINFYNGLIRLNDLRCRWEN